MTWSHGAWGAVGAMLGVLHAAGIWRTARRPTTTSAVLGLLRLCTVGLALAVAAVLGVLIPVATGWVVGIFTAVVAMFATFHSGERRGAP